MTKHLTSNSPTMQEIESIRDNRKTSYGTPEDNFQSIANYWNEYLRQKGEGVLTAIDVARMMSLLKLGRMFGGVDKHDNYIDAANYLIIAGDMLQTNTKEQTQYAETNEEENRQHQFNFEVSRERLGAPRPDSFGWNSRWFIKQNDND